MMTANAWSGSRWHRDSVRDAYFPRCCSMSSSLRYSSSHYYVMERFSKDAGILADLIRLKERPSKVGPETVLECVQRAIWGMLYADDACIVSRSPRGLGRMMAVFVEVFGTFCLTISESKTETMCMPIPRAPAAKIVFNATGQQYRQTTSFTYLEEP